MKISRPTAFAIGAVMALVLGSGTAVAATGGKFILGKANSATTTTKLTNSRGTALALTSKAGTAPLTVNSPTKVGNLNADKLDGYDSSQLALAGGQTNAVTDTGFLVDASGDYVDDTLVAAVSCPAGTKLTGGGGDDYTSDGTLFVNAPLDKTTWWVASSADIATADVESIDVYALCYNPRGTIPGGAYRTAEAVEPSAQQIAMMTAKLAKKQR